MVVEAARYRLGACDRESFQGLARALLLDGRDEGVPLLSLRDAYSERARSVFERMCASLSQAIPGLEDAAKVVITSIAYDLDDGQIAAPRAIELLGELSGSFPDRRVAGDLGGGRGAAGGSAGLFAAAQALAVRGSRSGQPKTAVTAAHPTEGSIEDDVRRFARDWLAVHQATVAEILTTRCGRPIDRDWRELAAEKRAGEDRLIDRYRHDLFGKDPSPASQKSRTQQTPWGQVSRSPPSCSSSRSDAAAHGQRRRWSSMSSGGRSLTVRGW